MNASLSLTRTRKHCPVSLPHPPLSHSASPRARKRLRGAELPSRFLSLTSEEQKQWPARKLTDLSRDLIGQRREEKQVQLCGDWEDFSLPLTPTLSSQSSSSSLPAIPSRR